MKRKIIKVISIILCICFLVGTISVSADVTTSSEKEIKNPTVNVKKEDKKADSKYLLGTEELKTAKLEKTEIPELITQEQIEENKHVNRLYDLEDENSVVFQNRDGTETLYTFADPIQYKDSKGKLHDKKRTLKVSDSEEYAYEITTSNVKSYFPNEISTEKGIMVKDEDNKISMKPLYSQEKNNELKGQAKNSIKKEARTSIAKKISKKNSNQDCNGVDYNETFGEGTRVRYTPTYSGIKEDIIIDSPECENRYSFEVDTGDLVAVKKDGYINFLDPLTGEKEAEISPVYIYDSAEIPNVSTDGYYEIEKKSEGKYIVTLVADESFLNSDSTVYPVYLDPSLGLNFGVSVINDAIMYKKSETISKSASEGTIGNRGDKYGCGRLLICFSKLESSNATYKAITDSSRIKNASLSLYMYGDTKDSSIRPVLYEYDWLQMYNNSECGSYGVKIGWNAFKALNDMPAKTVKTTSTVDKQTFDVTPAVKYWKDQSVYTAKTGLMIKVINDDETNTNYRKQVYTANKSDYKPSLVITYNRNLTLDKTNVTINQGETSRLTATLQPETNVNDLVFVSSNSDIVTIDNRSDSIAGQIVKSSVNLNGVGYGTTTVIVTSKKNPEWFKTCTVTVKYLYGISVQNAYPDTCEMSGNNYDSFAEYANNLDSGLSSKLNKAFYYSGSNSCANDFKNKNMPGATHRYINIDDVDLMIYTGHGYAKNRDKKEGKFNYNGFHFGHSDSGNHPEGIGTGSEYNFTTEDAKYFGYNAKTKWLVAYTCNFLNEAQGDTNVERLLDRGGRLILGLGTKSYIMPQEGTDFATYLLDGDHTIAEAFFAAGRKNQDLGDTPPFLGISGNNKCAKKYKVLHYGSGTEDTINDTLTAPLSDVPRVNPRCKTEDVNKYDFNDFEES